ncbi:hypothetical protein BGX38DRAFT_1194005, partial [Terfezia claveryi]
MRVWVRTEVVEAGVQVLDLVWRGRGWVRLMVRAVRAVSIIDWGGCCGPSSGG